jgi:hypothetical protein
MKMKRFIYSLAVTAGLMGAMSCAENLDELLQDPNAVSSETASPDYLLNRIQLDYKDLWNSVADRGSRLTRQINQGSALYINAYTPVSTNDTWETGYAEILSDIQFLEPLAEAGNFQRHLGIAKTIKAMTLIDLVDTYGNVPYSEALDPNNFNPNTDNGETVYSAAYELLNQAAAHFTANSAGAPNDYFYGGNYARWIKLVNTLKLRYFLNMKLVDPAGATAGINALIAEGNLLGVGDDFVFKFGTTRADPDSRHPKFAGQYTNGGGDYQSTYFMHHLTVAKGFDDPRVRYYLYRQSLTNTTNVDEQECVSQLAPPHYLVGNYPYCNPAGNRGYWGRDHLDPDGVPPDGLRRTMYGVYPSGGRFDNNSALPVNNPALGAQGAGIYPIMLAAFVDFMLAEAALTLGTTGDPKALLSSAISKHINYVRSFSVATAEGGAITSFYSNAEHDRQRDSYVAYVASEFDAASSADAKMNLVGREYWLSLFGSGKEAYNLYRRTGKPANMQPALEGNPGSFVRSFMYPTNYMVTNTNAVQKPDVSVQVFWDKNPASPWIN